MTLKEKKAMLAQKELDERLRRLVNNKYKLDIVSKPKKSS